MKAQEKIREYEKSQMRADLPKFHVGDRVKVFWRIQEGDRQRLQPFEGHIIRIANGKSLRTMVTVRKVSYGVGVERIFPIHSPLLDRIEIIQEGKVRRSRLYYLRGLRGKAARIAERRDNIGQDE
ncbi:MAG: 50S ribosomal protein L19 [Myxococcales bacterium]|nr:MAG: 50S ribosomal protein L19 [Myxococcales bacterium]